MTLSHISPHQPAALSAVIEPATVVTDNLSRYLTPILDLGLRIWMAHVFFTSGLQKIGDWGSTVFLFDFEYQVPLLWRRSWRRASSLSCRCCSSSA